MKHFLRLLVLIISVGAIAQALARQATKDDQAPFSREDGSSRDPGV